MKQSQTKILCLLLRDPENERCFKCKVSCSEWISVTLAVFLCTRCAQELKAIDNKRVKIKSLLQNLSSEELDRLAIGGNHAFTEYVNQHPSQPSLGQLMKEYVNMLTATTKRRHIVGAQTSGHGPSAVLRKFTQIFHALAFRKSRHLSTCLKEGTRQLWETPAVLNEEK